MRSFLVVSAALAVCAAPVVADDGWQYQVAPYIWASGLDGTSGIGPVLLDVDASFGDVVEDLEGGALVHFEATRGDWAILTDVITMSLGQDVGRSGKVDIDQLLLEVGASRRLNELTEVVFGLRYSDIDGRLRTAPGLDASASQDWVDPFVGVRIRPQLTERWHLQLRADVGGFGVGSDFAYNAQVLATVSASKSVEIGFGYRILDQDYEDGAGAGAFVYDVTTHGPVVGVGWSF